MKTQGAQLNRRQFLQGSLAAAGTLAAGISLPQSHIHAPTWLRLDDRPHIIYIVTDALRADHVGVYGYGRDTTPELDRWVANEGVTFREATSPAAWTFPGTVAMFTGRLPARLDANWNHTVLPAGVPTLAETLRAVGYTTAGFTCAPFSSASRALGRGFDVYNDSLAALPLHANTQAAQLNSLVNGWLNDWQGTAPLFLFLYYFDIHTWYNPPAPYDTRFDATYAGPLTPEVYQNGEPVVAGTIVPSSRDIEHLLALYDGEIAYWDARLGELFTLLEARGLLDNAIVAVTSDHGDMFGEHGLWTHGNSVYEEVVRVPLLLRYPGVTPKGLSVTAPAQNMDLMPTVLAWAGAPPIPRLDGVDLSSVAAGAPAAPRDVFNEVDSVTDPHDWAYWLAPRNTLHSIRRDAYKFIHHVGHEAADELYRLTSASPYEQDNLVAAEPALAAELRAAVIAEFDRRRVTLPVVVR